MNCFLNRSRQHHLYLALLRVLGMKTEAVFDQGPVPNLIRKSLVTDLGLGIIPVTRRITAVDGTVSKCVGTFEKISVFFWDSKIDVAFPVTLDLHLNAISGCPSMEIL